MCVGSAGKQVDFPFVSVVIRWLIIPEDFGTEGYSLGCGKLPWATVRDSVECFGLFRTDHSVWRGHLLMGGGERSREHISVPALLLEGKGSYSPLEQVSMSKVVNVR